MSIAGRYVLILMCDSTIGQPANTPGHNGVNKVYESRNQSECVKLARKDGWRLGLTEQVCPLCQGSDNIGEKNA